jgi:hypothetical protein
MWDDPVEEFFYARACYRGHMTRGTTALLDAFEHLRAEEKRSFTEEVLRRSVPFDSGHLEDAEIGAAFGRSVQIPRRAKCRSRCAVRSGSSISAWLARLGPRSSSASRSATVTGR